MPLLNLCVSLRPGPKLPGPTRQNETKNIATVLILCSILPHSNSFQPIPAKVRISRKPWLGLTFPRLLHHGQRSELLCGLGPVLMVFDALHGRHIPNATVRPLLIIFSAPGFNHDLGLLSREQPVLVQTLISKLAVEAFNTRVLDRLPRLDAVQRHPMLTGPCIQRRP
jgi:hypothetical protein